MSTPSLTMGRVALTVHDLDKVGAFYETVVGLAPLGRDGESARYGAGDTVLLELRRDGAARRRGRDEAGLFHTAFLLPKRQDLAQWVRHASEKRLAVTGVADHLVSEAVYLDDPEGNGVEIYADRPAADWRWRGGQVEMASDPLDVEGLLQLAEAGPAWQGVPGATSIGHVHLQVGRLPEAEGFYREVLGLDVTCHYPGATFFAADRYHHHIAANIWNSRGAGPRAMPSTGLAEVEIRLSAARTAEIAGRRPLTKEAGRQMLADPWGTPIALVTKG